MARTTLTPEAEPTVNPLAENTLAFTVADVANGNQFAHTGRELLIVENIHATVAKTVTLQSVTINGRQDPKHNVAQSIPALERRAYGRFGEGWKQSDGYVYVNGESVDVKFCVITLAV